MGPCRSFGWSALVPPFQYTLSAYCTSPTCETVSFEKRKLIDLFEADPSMGYEIMSRLATVVGERFHRLQEDIATRRGHEIMHNW